MNKRQAKKAFKKKYGVNPNQMGKALVDFDWYKFGQDLGNAINDALSALAQAINIAAEKLRAYEEGRKNGTITITGEKVLLDMWDDTKSSQTPCNTREKE